MQRGSVPAHVWLVLGVAICGVSSAGAIFTHVDDIPPLLRASWRLQLTALILAPLALWQFNSIDEEVKSKLFEMSTGKIILASSTWCFWVAIFSSATEIHTNPFWGIMYPPDLPIIYHNSKGGQFYGHYDTHSGRIIY